MIQQKKCDFRFLKKVILDSKVTANIFHMKNLITKAITSIIAFMQTISFSFHVQTDEEDRFLIFSDFC